MTFHEGVLSSSQVIRISLIPDAFAFGSTCFSISRANPNPPKSRSDRATDMAAASSKEFIEFMTQAEASDDRSIQETIIHRIWHAIRWQVDAQFAFAQAFDLIMP